MNTRPEEANAQSTMDNQPGRKRKAPADNVPNSSSPSNISEYSVNTSTANRNTTFNSSAQHNTKLSPTDGKGNVLGKLFVGGLQQFTTTDGLRTYFSKFGEIEEATVMMDNRTDRSQGYGYVKFKNPSSVDKVLSESIHLIDNKRVDPKKCNINMRGKNTRSLKIFVGGINFKHTEEDIRNCFEAYGTVTDVNFLSIPGGPLHRGFAFVGFDDEEVVKNLINLHYVNIKDKQVEIKPMEPRKPDAFRSSTMSHNTVRPLQNTPHVDSLNPSYQHSENWNRWQNPHEPVPWNTPHDPSTYNWNQPMWNNTAVGNGASMPAAPSYVPQGSANPNGMGWGTHVPMQNSAPHPPWTQQPTRQPSAPNSEQLRYPSVEQQWHHPQPVRPMCPPQAPSHFPTPTNEYNWHQQPDPLQWNSYNSAPRYGMEMTGGIATRPWNEQTQPEGMTAGFVANTGQPNNGAAFKTNDMYASQPVAQGYSVPPSNNGDWQSSTPAGPTAATVQQDNYYSQQQQSLPTVGKRRFVN